MKICLTAALASVVLTLISGKLSLPLLKKLKAGQPILKYVEVHKSKNGTPTMGGLFFILSGTAVYFIFGGGTNRISLVACALGLAFMVVGFLDDFIKVKLCRNEGLKAYQKIVFQTAIAVLAGVFCYNADVTSFYIPFVKQTVDLGFWTIPIVGFVFIAVVNSVNLTDGLDGLAASSSLSYLLFIFILIVIERQNVDVGFTENNDGLLLLIASLFGAICGFLTFNTNKASVFMGDTGSLSLGGFIASASILSRNLLFIPIIGMVFVMSSLSVILQVAYFKITGKRVFLMAPLHHHFQLNGISEPKISFAYSLLTCISGAIVVIFYL